MGQKSPPTIEKITVLREVVMPTTLQKDEAHKIIDKMPQDATWDDLIHKIYVRQTIERGLEDSDSGQTKDVQEVRAKYGLQT